MIGETSKALFSRSSNEQLDGGNEDYDGSTNHHLSWSRGTQPQHRKGEE